MGKLNLATVNDVMAKVTARGDMQVMLWLDEAGKWQPITSEALYGRVRALADVLKGWGIVKGDRVALLCENRWEWIVTDLAVLALGAVDVPLYSTLTPEQVGYMLRDSGAKVAILSTKVQYDKLASVGELPALEHVVVMDAGEFGNAESFAKLLEAAPQKQAHDQAFDAVAASIGPDDLATIIYTSGTTGEPKGVMLTHGNLASNVSHSMGTMGFSDRDSVISFLPLSHVTARHTDYGLMARGVRIAYLPKFDLLPAAMQEVKPTIFLAVPRVYEKIREGVEGKSSHSSVKKRILAWALRTGTKHRASVMQGVKPKGMLYGFADRLVYSKIKQAFGGCVDVFISGGAPLGMESAGWFADAGIRIFEGYGLTETSPVIAVNAPEAHKIGTVGKPLDNVDCRFAADGELEVRGPSIFKGYWNKPKEDAEAFTDDGWFRTGDIGNIDGDGFLSITDRKKELLKTSGGKLIAPQPIENKLKAETLVSQAALVGDKHKFACVLISPNLEALGKWAAGQGIAAKDPAALVKEAKVKAEYERIVAEVNKTLAHFETIKRVTVVPEEWTVEGGEMTPSMKMKRRVIEKKYAAEIDAFYADEANSRE